MSEITKDMWAKWNAENPPPTFSFEQTIVWLDDMRQFIFELWKNNPKLKEAWDAENEYKKR